MTIKQQNTAQSRFTSKPPSMGYRITCFLGANTTHCKTSTGSQRNVPFINKPKSIATEKHGNVSAYPKELNMFLKFFLGN